LLQYEAALSAPVIEIRSLGPGDEAMLIAVEPDVFDNEVQPHLAAEFLADPRHHIVVACHEARVVGFASAVHYLHPDKPSELWVNEVGVAPTYQRRGVARQLLRALFDVGRAAGCRKAWVLTERSNAAAMELYRAVGGREAADETVMFDFGLESPESRGT
jgi:ribosomal protein S18 acetylase RimI-like enzyme